MGVETSVICILTLPSSFKNTAKNESDLAINILVLLLSLRISGEWGYLGVERGGEGGALIASSLFFRDSGNKRDF